MKTSSLLLLLFLALFIGCKKKTIEICDPNDSQNNSYTLTNNVLEVSNQLNGNIISIDSNSIVFSGTGHPISVNMILISGINVNAPMGYMRKVVSIDSSGGNYVLQTEPASLDEAYEELHVRFSKSFDLSDTIKSSEPEFGLAFNDFVLYDQDGNYSTSNDQIRFDGFSKVRPIFTFDVDLTNGIFKYGLVELGYEQDLSNSITVGGALAGFSEEINFYTITLAPIQIPSTLLVFIPKIELFIGVNGSVTASITGEYSQNKTVKGFMKYENSSWSAGKTKDVNNSVNFSAIAGDINASAYVGGRLNFKLYGSSLLQGGFEIKSSADFHAWAFPTPDCSIDLNLKGNIFAESKIFGQTVASAIFPQLIDETQNVFTCSDPSSPPVTAFTCQNTNLTIGETTQFNNLSTGQNNSYQWSFPGGTPSSSNQLNPQIQYNTPGVYNVTLVATNNNGNDSETTINLINVQSPSICPNSVVDIDGNSYSVIQIGNQCWFKENLKVTKYQNGDPMISGVQGAAIFATTSGTYINGQPEYGLYYNWYAVADSRNICPSGYHPSTDDDWKDLETFLGMSYGDLIGTGLRGTVQGGWLKSTSNLWIGNNVGANDSLGFTALPSSYYRTGPPQFEEVGESAYFWTSSQASGANGGTIRGLNIYSGKIRRQTGIYKSILAPCRCVAN